MAAVKLSITVPDDLVAQVDVQRGRLTRSAFVTQCIERAVVNVAPGAGQTQAIEHSVPEDGPNPHAVHPGAGQVQGTRSQVPGAALPSAAARAGARATPKGGKR